MRRGENAADALETINAAATVIASAGARDCVQRRWGGSCFSISWCFGLNKSKRIGHAVIIPGATTAETDGAEGDASSRPSSILLPFIAPPSSPASYHQSETTSVVQSPTGKLSATMYSPRGPCSIFATGPYAHETQLVSPPVFSTFTTEPSTAPYTPPPESVHLTMPSSPEVPFAKLVEPPALPNVEEEGCRRYQQHEFLSYHLQPGSPVSHLISPCSGISGSGASSPFPDMIRHFFLDVKSGNQPTLSDLEKVLEEWSRSHPGSGVATPNGQQNSSDACSVPVPWQHKLKNLQKKKNVEPIEEEMSSDGESRQQHHHERCRRTITLGSSREFDFENAEEDEELDVEEEEEEACKNWSFPVMQAS